MFSYYLRLAVSSLRQTPAITALMIGAIALGIGVSMTMFSTVYMLSGNPIPEKSSQLFAVQIDAWDPEGPYRDDQPDDPPTTLTYPDTVGVLNSGIPTREAAMYKSGFVVDPDNRDIQPFGVSARLTSGDFFEMFNVPFVHGGPWSKADYDNAARVVVINQETNDKLFGGENSVGQSIRLSDADYRIVGIIENWHPKPKFHDLENGPFNDSEAVYAPFTLFEAYEVGRNGNTNCWKDEAIETYQDLLNSECVWPSVWVELENAEQKAQYAAFLDAYVTEQKALGRHERPMNNKLRDVMEWLQFRDVVGDEARIVVVIGFLFLVVCLVNIIGLLLARFIGKSGVIGVRRALGASKGDIFKQHLVEVGFVGLVGGGAGLLLTLVGFQGIRKLFPEMTDFTQLDFSMVMMGLTVAIATSLIAGLYPTWRICQLQPARYLKTQ